MWPLITTAGVIAFAAAILPDIARGYGDGAPPGHMGGNGRPTCQACHFDAESVTDSTSLCIVGLEPPIKPGEKRMITIQLVDSVMQRAGVQLTAEFKDDAQTAGRFTFVDASLEVLDGDKVVTVRSTAKGSRLSSPGVAEWRVKWLAPDTNVDRVTFWLAANAANGDGSAFGDRIHTRRVDLAPSAGKQPSEDRTDCQ